MRIVAALLGLLTLAAAAGCSESSDDGGTGTEPSGRIFVSTAVDGTPIPGGGPLTLDFTHEGQMSANAGCNTASGSVEFSGGTLTAGNLASTLMACEPGLAESDSWTTTLLSSNPSWSLDGDTLVLTTDELTVTLQDKKVAMPDLALEGTTWTVTSLVSPDAVTSSVVLDTAAPDLTIAADGAVSGSTGCNRLTGHAEIAGTTVTFGPLATTRMACPPENADLERQILAALDGEVTYRIDAHTLTLTRPDGIGLILTAQA